MTQVAEGNFMVNTIEYGKIRFALSDERKDLVALIRQAEAAERYEDMCLFSRRLALLARATMTREERNLFTIAHRHVLSAKRAAWRTMVHASPHHKLTAAYRTLLENEIRTFCDSFNTFLVNEILNTIDTNDRSDQRIFFTKQVADNFRYLAELDPHSQGSRIDYVKSARQYYHTGVSLAESLQPNDPVRLGLALNYSVFQYEVLKDAKTACEIAKTAFDKAINRLDELDEEDYKDATLVMQLMRDNLALWVSLDQAQVQQQ